MLRLVAFALLLLAGAGAQAQEPARPDHVTLGLDWRAEAEYGGYYQAVATGIYARHGLDVTLRQGGPQLNQAQLLLAGRLDFNLASNSYLALAFAQEKLPFVAVAAMFQKDPSVLIAHPGQGNDSFEALRGKPIMIGADTRAGWWNFLKARFGYSDSQVRPYTFNLQPFLADKAAIQQGYLGSEPFSIQAATGTAPVVLLIADAGFTGYGSLITTSTRLANTRPDLVQRFLDASIEGWYSYLDGDPSPGNALIKHDNPEMTDQLLAFGRAALKQHGILESGDAATSGIGAMSDARWHAFAAAMIQDGLAPKDFDPGTAYTLRFVNHRTGLPAR
jgi:NitT/TauT family transport system substrate-binding protein